jgi:hypothetical protein
MTDTAERTHPKDTRVIPVVVESAPRSRSFISRHERLALPALLVAGVTLWVISLSHIHLTSLGTYGLPPALPITWYVGLGALVGGAVIAIWGVEHPRPWVIACFLLAVTLVLYMTIPSVATEPQYSWVYKHIGVARFIEAHGYTQGSVDIYNRWPGFFAAVAVIAQLAGRNDPTTFATYAEPMYALLAVLLVAAIGWSVTHDRRVAGSAALIFLLSNWVRPISRHRRRRMYSPWRCSWSSCGQLPRTRRMSRWYDSSSECFAGSNFRSVAGRRCPGHDGKRLCSYCGSIS